MLLEIRTDRPVAIGRRLSARRAGAAASATSHALRSMPRIVGSAPARTIRVEEVLMTGGRPSTSFPDTYHMPQTQRILGRSTTRPPFATR